MKPLLVFFLKKKKTSNNFRAGTICRRFKIFSSARKQSGPLPGLLCAEICSRYGQSSDSAAAIPRALMQTPLHANTLQQQHLLCATLRCRERGGWVGGGWTRSGIYNFNQLSFFSTIGCSSSLFCLSGFCNESQLRGPRWLESMQSARPALSPPYCKMLGLVGNEFPASVPPLL